MKYYCPYCNPKYQFSKKDSNQKLYCGLCGEYLVRQPTIKIKQIIALIIVITFIFPLLYLFFFSVIDRNNKETENYNVINKVNLKNA